MKHPVGKYFMFGFIGTEPTPEILNFIKNDGLGGVILFRRNIESSEQLKRMTGELQDAAGGKLFISIDQEGGRVSNLPSSIIDVPPMEELGNRHLNGESSKQAHWLGHEFGEKLRMLGINVDFAPVLDVNTNHRNPIIGNRAFSCDPEIVARLGCEVARGMAQMKLISCGKHFPGHGDTVEDSHHTLPKLMHDRKRLDEIELVPFKRAIENNIPSLMSSHVIYHGIDSENPATLSKKILTELLREELKFKGLLFSDDLEMNAICDNYQIHEAAWRAFDSGCDIMLVCHMFIRQRASLDEFQRAVDDGRISSKRLKESSKRIDKLYSLL